MRWMIAKPKERSTCRVIGSLRGSITLDSRIPFRGEVLSVSLRETSVTDNDLHGFDPLPSLHSLELGYTAITDRGIAALTRHSNLSYLFLWGTKITDSSISILLQMPKLLLVNVTHTDVSLDACTRLSTAMPNCLVSHAETATIFRGEINSQDPYAAWLNRDETGFATSNKTPSTE